MALRSWLPAPALALLLAAPLYPAAAETPVSPWALPPEGTCQPAGGLRGWPPGEDAAPLPFETGDELDIQRLPVLKDFLPAEIWTYRERFFYEGMLLEIGPCFRDYGPPEFFREATASFGDRTRLLEGGGIEGYVAGLPFAPDAVPAGDPDAGMKWAWNFENRYQGGGLRGVFRISDLLGRVGRAEPWLGEIFKIHTAHRADRPGDDYRVPAGGTNHWVAGGLMFEPFAARHYAWRQYRDVEHERSARRSDDLHAYIPEMRRVRRLNSSQLEGLHMPSFAIGVKGASSGALAAVGGGPAEVGGAGSAGTIVTRRSGFEGLEMRPLLYNVKILGLHDVLAPINGARPLYPENPDQEFGPWGLSFATDRWDLRRALVLEATRRSPASDDRFYRMTLYVDLQTLHPLYYMSYDPNGNTIDVGMFVGRWSEDRPEYPRWPDDPERPVRVIDSAAAAFANLNAQGSWRRESWDLVSIPPPDRELKRMLSVSGLTRRR
ncbi:MAG: DUF1329 domain-containing protein [Myxococcota bacterium]